MVRLLNNPLVQCHPETPRVMRGGLRIFLTKRSRNKFGMTKELKNLIFFFLLLFFSLKIATANTEVLPIQPFKTSSGLEVWFVEDHTSPIVSLVLTFDKANIESPFQPLPLLFQKAVSSGAGLLSPLEMDRFSKETPAWFRLEIGTSRTSLTLKTTKDGLASTLKLWSNLMSDPRFQKANLDHSKAQALKAISNTQENLEDIAFFKLLQTIFPNNSFEIDFEKASEIIKSLTAADLEKETVNEFLASKPKIVVVGDTSKQKLTALLDSTFGALPLKSPTSPPPPLALHWSQKEVFMKKDIPQSFVTFGQPGINPQSKDYPKYLLLQYVLYERMFDELREKRGLIYSIYFTENHYREVDLLVGYFSCECSNAKRIAKFIRTEWEKLKDFGITQRELSAAKLSFKRNKILSLTSPEAVAVEYANFLVLKLGHQAAKSLLESTEKITLQEMNEFTQNILKPESLTFVLVGSSLKSSPSKDKK